MKGIPMTTHALYRMMCLGFSAAIALQATVLRADEITGQKTNEQFAVKLTDDSSLICKPQLTAIPLNMDYANLSIPFRHVDTLTIDHKTNNVVVVLLNGDRLQGRCPLQDITVTCLLGDLTIPLVHITEIITTLKKEPVFEDSPAKRNSCINNLRQIDAGKEQWALANRRGNGDPVDIDGVNAYIKGNRTPICPAGGKYTYKTIGENPECNVPGHKLPH